MDKKRVLFWVDVVFFILSAGCYLVSFFFPESGFQAMISRILYFSGMLFLLIAVILLLLRMLLKQDSMKEKAIRWIVMGLGVAFIVYAIGVLRFSFRMIEGDLEAGAKVETITEYKLSEDEKSLFIKRGDSFTVLRLAPEHAKKVKASSGKPIDVSIYQNNMILLDVTPKQ
ncbi:hypothetical protein [Guggenheimella bovis]